MPLTRLNKTRDFDESLLVGVEDDGQEIHLNAVTAIHLIQTAGRIGWTIAEAHQRFARLVPLGLTLPRAGSGLRPSRTGLVLARRRSSASAGTRTLIGVALGLLLTATILVTRAIAGPPGGNILMTGEELMLWSEEEVQRISTLLWRTPWLALGGIVAVAVAVAVTWLALAQNGGNPVVQVNASTGHQSCGQLIGVSNHELIVDSATGPVLVPLSAVTAITPVAICP